MEQREMGWMRATQADAGKLTIFEQVASQRSWPSMEHGVPSGGWTAPHDCRCCERRTLPAATRVVMPGSSARERMFGDREVLMVLIWVQSG